MLATGRKTSLRKQSRRFTSFEKKQLRVHHMLITKSRKNYNRKNHMKMADGKRVLALDDDTLEVLCIWKKRQTQHRDMDFIFSYDGFPMIKSTIARIIARYAKIASVLVIQAKGLRHSHVSFLITYHTDVVHIKTDIEYFKYVSKFLNEFDGFGHLSVKDIKTPGLRRMFLNLPIV